MNNFSNCNNVNNGFNAEAGFRMLGSGVSISNDTHFTGMNNNDLIIGGPGSGKTSGYVSHLLMNPYGSYVISDTKGLLHRKFSKYLENKGYTVRVIDFVKPSNSIPYNPLKYIGFNESGAPIEANIKKLARSLFAGHTNRDDFFWCRMAERYISMLVSYVLEATDESEQTMAKVVELYHSYLDGEGEEIIKEWSVCHPDSFASRKYKELAGSKNAEKMWFSTMEFVNEALDAFDTSEFHQMFSVVDSFDIRSLGREKTVLFLNTSDSDRTFDKLVNLFNTQALQCLMEEADSNADGRLRVPVRLVLDDFGASSKLEDFDNITSVIRSREISVSIILQADVQLTKMYGEYAAATIKNNCDHQLFLSGHDISTCQYVANHINKTVHSVLAKSKNKAILITEGENARYIDKLDCIIAVPDVV